jgi:hypothetical protein
VYENLTGYAMIMEIAESPTFLVGTEQNPHEC